MMRSLALLLPPLLLAFVPGSAPGERPPVRFSQFVVQQRVMVRRTEPVQPVAWTEKKGPKCLPLDGLAGALVTKRDAVDLVHAGGFRTRAVLNKECRTLDFYSGLYLRPTADGLICAGRDAVRTRSGRLCEIDRFRKLVAKR